MNRNKVQKTNSLISTWVLYKRHFKLFYNEKTRLVFTFMGPIIVFIVFILFGKTIFGNLEGFSEQQRGVMQDIFLGVGLLLMATFTNALSLSNVTVVDNERGTVNDFEVAPIRKYSIKLSYFSFNISVNFLQTLIVFLFYMAYLGIRGSFYVENPTNINYLYNYLAGLESQLETLQNTAKGSDNLSLATQIKNIQTQIHQVVEQIKNQTTAKSVATIDFIRSVKLLVVLLYSCLINSLIFTTLLSKVKSYNIFSLISAVFSSIGGFFIGAYIPLQSLPVWIQEFASIFPSTQAGNIIRVIMLQNGPFDIVLRNNPIHLFGQTIELWQSFVYSLSVVIVFFFIVNFFDNLKVYLYKIKLYTRKQK